MIYDLAPGECIERPDDAEPLTEEELEKAREAFAKGTSLEKIAKRLKAKVYERPDDTRTTIGVDLEALERLADHAGLDDEARAELGLPPKPAA